MEINRAFLGSMLRCLVELSDLLGKCGCNNMVWVPISNQNRSNFVELGMTPAVRANEYSSANQCSHKIDFLLS